MDIDEFIKELMEFKNYKSPNKIRIICGITEFFKPIQRYKEIDNISIDIYKQFEYFAFTLDNKCAYKGSDTSIWRILVNNRIDVIKLFSQIKVKLPNGKPNQLNINQLINFLYFHEGIVLINRDTNKKMFEIFNKYNVTDVLFVGKSVPYKSLTKFFTNDTRFGVVYHPSRRVGIKKNWFYENLDSSAIEEVSYFNKKYQKTSFASFSICLFSDNK